MNHKLFSALVLTASINGSAEAAEFYNQTFSDGTEAIIVSGEIVSGDEERFRNLSIKYPKAMVALQSSGGAIKPALEIGRQIRLRGYDTIVLDGESCASACALIWIAGSRRIIWGTGRVGFHASYIDDQGQKVESGVANAIVGYYLSQLNLSEKAVIFATLAPPDKVSWLTTSDRTSPIDFEVWEREPAKEEPISPPPVYKIPSTTVSFSSSYDWLLEQRSTPGFSLTAAKALGATGEMLPLLSEHLEILWNNDEFLKRTAQELQSARIDPRQDPSGTRTILFNLTTSLMMKGLKRLPQRNVNSFFSIFSEALGKSGESCQEYTKATDKITISEFKAVYATGSENLKDYLSILRASLLSEISDYPKSQIPTEKQIELGQSAWVKSLLEMFDNDSTKVDNFFSIIDDIDNAPPKQACAALYITVYSVSEMPGLTGDWMRRNYINEMGND